MLIVIASGFGVGGYVLGAIMFAATEYELRGNWRLRAAILWPVLLFPAMAIWTAKTLNAEHRNHPAPSSAEKE